VEAHDSSVLVRGNIFQQNSSGSGDTGYGGGFSGAATVCDNLFLDNSTQGYNSGYGGAAYLTSGSFVNNTLIENIGDSRGQASGVYAKAGTTVANNIIVGGTGGVGIFSDGSVTADFNDIWNNDLGSYGGLATPGSHDIHLDPLLGPLGNYGGPTQTIPLLPGNPAIDAGSNSLIPLGVTTDQRGFARIVGSAVDLGAFEYGSMPVVTGIAPSSGLLAGGTSVTIAGTGFTGATAVDLGATPATSFNVVSDSEVTATSPAGAGTVDVTVTAAGQPSGTSLADQFTYVAAPAVTGLSPTAGATVGGTTVAIGGWGFTGATGVEFGSQAATSFTVNSDSSIKATSPAGSGTVDVTVTTPGGTSATSSADQFTYLPSPVEQPTPVLGVTIATGTYTGLPFAGHASVAGGNGVPRASLEGVSPTLTYYAGGTAGGRPLAGPPKAVGVYTVVASFPGSTDYAAVQSGPVRFTITRSTAVVKVTVVSGDYTGAAVTATATLTVPGGAPASSLEGVSPMLRFYAGRRVTLVALPGPPTAAGTYTVVASFAGTADYEPAESRPLTFHILPATPVLGVCDAAGTFKGSCFSASVTIAGVCGAPAATLEGIKPTVAYYAGVTASGAPLGGAPLAAGTYTVVASFPGSRNYTAAESTPLVFTISRATPTVTVACAGGTYTGRPCPATARVIGTSGIAAASLETVAPTLTYYMGSCASGTGSCTPPTAPGTYTVMASFAGSADYGPAQSQPRTFYINVVATPFGSHPAAGKSTVAKSPAALHDAALLAVLIHFS
jgi:hypothetical protein